LTRLTATLQGKLIEMAILKPQSFQVCFLVVALCAIVSLPASAKERHSGYYYPEPKQIEIYKTRALILPGSNKVRRIGFVTALTQVELGRPYPPITAIFAKGAESQKLIIVANQPGRLDTIFRIRAYLATLTATARTTPIFRQTGVETILTFFDLVRMLGFEQVTISDGDTFTHQVRFE